MTSLDDALAAVLAQAQRLDGPESVDLFSADGRVLWSDCVSALQVPPQDNSAMDGYAVRLADVPVNVGDRVRKGQVIARLQAGLADMRHDYAFDVKPRWPLSDLNATPAPAPVTA